MYLPSFDTIAPVLSDTGLVPAVQSKRTRANIYFVGDFIFVVAVFLLVTFGAVLEHV